MGLSEEEKEKARRRLAARHETGAVEAVRIILRDRTDDAELQLRYWRGH